MKDTKPTGWMKRRDRMVAARDEYFTFLDADGPALVAAAQGDRSLRELAKVVGLSPTYLSLVRTGQKRISVRAYSRLAEVAS